MRNFLMLFALVGMTFITSCEEDDIDTQNPDDDKKSMTVKEVMESEAEYSHTNEAVEESEQSDFYSDANADVTVFVATNSAWEDVFAEAEVSSMSELEAQMGEEAFAQMVMYHSMNGRFHYSDFEDGHRATRARADDENHLTVFVQNENDARLVFNGNNGKGASTTSTAVVEASNGHLIEIDAVIQAQSNYENIEDAEEENGENQLYFDLMSNAEAGTVAMLQDESNNNTVLVTNDTETANAMRVYFHDIIDDEDLQALLDANAQSTLFTQYNVSSISELRSVVTFDDIINIGMLTTAEIIAELEAEDRSEYMAHLIFSGYANFEEAAANNAQVTSEAGVAYEATSSTDGQVTLTGGNGNQIVLQEKTAQSVNGSVYSVASIK